MKSWFLRGYLFPLLWKTKGDGEKLKTHSIWKVSRKSKKCDRESEGLGLDFWKKKVDLDLDRDFDFDFVESGLGFQK